jgi:integrase
MSKKGQYRYYVQIWDLDTGGYSIAKSAASIAVELGLDEKAFPPTSRTGATLIGQELLNRGNPQFRKDEPLFADFCDEIWAWDTSSYIQGKLARGQRIGREYVGHNAAYVRNYIRPAFPSLKLSGVKAYMLEEFAARIKKDAGLGNRSINAILMAASVPLAEAARLGLIGTNPAVSVHRHGNDTKEKGIPTEEEMRNLLALTDLDLRIRAAILLGAACALRLGEIQALRLSDIGETTLKVAHSWGKVEGLKSTKTDKARIVPLPRAVRSALLQLASVNPHGPDGFLMYGKLRDAPLDIRALERWFYKALALIGIDESRRTARALSFHSLRHWSNAMLRGAVPDAKLRMLTGHSTEAMTARYDHATEADLLELANAQEARILPFIGEA